MVEGKRGKDGKKKKKFIWRSCALAPKGEKPLFWGGVYCERIMGLGKNHFVCLCLLCGREMDGLGRLGFRDATR